MAEVRVRFAPSPTGFFHIGSARTALFNWLYARHTGGKFILRIEDTDKERNTEEALRVLIGGMQWLGLDWDEGPGAGGDYGPYFQSQRGEIYKEYLEKLKATGRTYEKDGAVWFKLEGERYTEFDKRADAEIEKVRTEPVVIDDAVRGRVERREERDFVLMRSDGSPVFHFVNVVDDIAMGITHVIRGEDHLSNTSKHVELFKAFGVEPPRFAHIPLILKSEGKGKMSKRDVGALIEEYEIKGYLSEAVRNYICLLGWSPKDDQEIMPIDDIIERFDFSGINKGNARFDEKKLNYINGEYLRKLPVETFCWLVRAPLTAAGVMSEDADEDYFQRIMMLCQEKTNAVADLPDYVRYFFSDEYPTDEKARAKIFKKGDPLARLTELKPALEAATDWSEECLEKIMGELCEKTGAKTGEYIHATRLAVSGTTVGPSFYGLLALIGKDRTLARIDRFLAENKV